MRKSLGNIGALLQETSEAYYWVGFLMADGYINHDTGAIQLAIAEKDKAHMLRFCAFIGSKISTIKKGKFKYVATSLTEKQKTDLIIKKFSFNPRKTYNPPINLDIKEDGMFLAFLLGYIDGDGCIEKERVSLQIHCHANWGEILNTWFERAFKLSGATSFNSLIKVPKFRLDKKGAAVIFTRNPQLICFLKEKINELSLPYLARKWDRVQQKPNRYQKAFELKKTIKKLLALNKSVVSISRQLGIGHQYIYTVKNS